MDSKGDNIFAKLQKKANEMGISDEQLKASISESGGDLAMVVKSLSQNFDPNIKPETSAREKVKSVEDENEKFTGDRLFGEPAVMRRFRGRGRLSLDDFNSDKTPKSRRTEVQKTKVNQLFDKGTRGGRGSLFPPGSDLLMSNRSKRMEINDIVNKLQKQVPNQRDEPFRFPSTEHDFNMTEVVVNSIKNYRKAKNKFNPVKNEDRYSPFTANLF